MKLNQVVAVLGNGNLKCGFFRSNSRVFEIAGLDSHDARLLELISVIMLRFRLLPIDETAYEKDGGSSKWLQK